jgi:hypothetical protein
VQHYAHYTVEEANALLGWVGTCVKRLRVARRVAEATGPEALQATADSDGGGSWPGLEHAAAAVDFVLTLEQLQDRDIVVRDLDRGLIDFPSLLGDEEVYLCWLVDEPEVSHWHAVGGGFIGRRRIS